MKYYGKHIWIIGASSGIGAALAMQLAEEGARLTLSSRSEDALAQLKYELPGTAHKVLPLDVRDDEAVREAAQEVAAGFVDSVIFLAALYEPMELESLDMRATAAMVDVNLMGAFRVINAVIPILKKQGKGQFALCGSVAGYAGLPNAQPYSATKAAIRNLAESLKAELHGQGGIDIRLISPGFVRTPLTDKNRFPMPCILEPDEAARYIADGLAGDDFEIHFPKRFTLMLKFLAFLPYPLYFRLMKRFI
ncbi:MAG: SDR family NAD(P)-dependent oxidoreductase [Alphaproteobacteria bacterium]|nr:SDR family NAD(P)-dependent oxidoreductase [Alphaproteobacteria bacterium]